MPEDALDDVDGHPGLGEQRARGVPELVDGDGPRDRRHPQGEVAGRALRQLARAPAFPEPAARAPTLVVEADDQARRLQPDRDAPVDVDLVVVHAPVPPWEDEHRVGRVHRGAEVGHQVSRDGDHQVLAGLGGLLVPAPPKRDLELGPVEVGLEQAEELAFAKSGEEGGGNDPAPLTMHGLQQRPDLIQVQVIRRTLNPRGALDLLDGVLS
ncbi:MAG: hypothetical protein QM767_11530 [Anaeromyxobacter sp.]